MARRAPIRLPRPKSPDRWNPSRPLQCLLRGSPTRPLDHRVFPSRPGCPAAFVPLVDRSQGGLRCLYDPCFYRRASLSAALPRRVRCFRLRSLPCSAASEVPPSYPSQCPRLPLRGTSGSVGPFYVNSAGTSRVVYAGQPRRRTSRVHDLYLRASIDGSTRPINLSNAEIPLAPGPDREPPKDQPRRLAACSSRSEATSLSVAPIDGSAAASVTFASRPLRAPSEKIHERTGPAILFTTDDGTTACSALSERWKRGPPWRSRDLTSSNGSELTRVFAGNGEIALIPGIDGLWAASSSMAPRLRSTPREHRLRVDDDPA